MSELSGMAAINAGSGNSVNSGAANGATPPSVPNGAGVGGDNTPSTWFAPEHANIVQTKGWQNPNDAISSYTNLEKLLGEKASAIVPPKPDADANEWSKFYERLGRPSDPTQYKFSKEGMDPKLAQDLGKWFHQAGLNDKQADAIIKSYSEFNKTYAAEADKNAMVQSNNDVLDLKQEWGNKFDDTVELARRATQFAMKEAGLTAEQLNDFEKAVGTKTMLKMMSAYGNMFKEAGVPDAGGGRFNTTPEYAKGEITRLQGDPEFRARYMHNDPKIRQEAIKQMETLMLQAYGDKPVV